MGSLACSLVVLLLAGSGAGTKYMETTLQDDAQFLHRAPAEVQKAARQVKALGADRVRLTASWSELVPQPNARKMPRAPFDPRDSRTYNVAAFRKLDTAVKAVKGAGLDVQIDLAFWAPRWAVRHPAANKRRQRLWPKSSRFAEFAGAVARRYNGGTSDPTAEDRKLPIVRMWTTWNEPNHPSFLGPQWRPDGKGGYRPASPHIYRAMHASAYDAVKQISHANQVLMGGTASMGSNVAGKGGVPPLQFARELACVDAKLEPLDVPECKGFRPLRADGWAHHPYSRYTTPGTSAVSGDDAPIADLSRLGGLLRALRQKGRIVGDLPMYHTEYGYETKQDDPHAPFTREDQARFIGWSTYLAWKDPDSRMMAQFLLRDIDPKESGRNPKDSRSYYRDWQSGLYAADGSPKPAAQAFKLPFWAQVDGDGDRKSVLLFGQVRPGEGPQVVRIDRLLPDTGSWAPVRTFGPTCASNGQDQEFLTDHSGFFLRAAAYDGPGVYRLSWQREDGVWEPGVPIDLFEGLPATPGASLRLSG